MNLGGDRHRRAKQWGLLTGRNKERKGATGTVVLSLVNEGTNDRETLCLRCASHCSRCWNTVVNKTDGVSALLRFMFSWGRRQKSSEEKP